LISMVTESRTSTKSSNEKNPAPGPSLWGGISFTWWAILGSKNIRPNFEHHSSKGL
jgi:hypothetical protein